MSLFYNTDASILALFLLAAMMGCIYFGRKVGAKRVQSEKETKGKATGMTISSMFGLLAFLLAFTFGMSATRFDGRRKNIIDEANAIGTAVLRTDLYNEEDRTMLKKEFQVYVEARISYYEVKKDVDEIVKSLKIAEEYGDKLWGQVAELSKRPENLIASQQMVPALNQMFDVRTTRWIGEVSRVPDTIVYMLFVLSLASAFYLGYSSAGKKLDWLVAAGFCVLTSLVIYITLDLDRPRRGLIQLDTTHRTMLELRKMF